MNILKNTKEHGQINPLVVLKWAVGPSLCLKSEKCLLKFSYFEVLCLRVLKQGEQFPSQEIGINN